VRSVFRVNQASWLGRRFLIAISRAFTTRSACWTVSMDHPTIRRLNESRTQRQETFSSGMGCSAMRVTTTRGARAGGTSDSPSHAWVRECSAAGLVRWRWVSRTSIRTLDGSVLFVLQIFAAHCDPYAISSGVLLALQVH
jgi:hypothetical protein